MSNNTSTQNHPQQQGLISRGFGLVLTMLFFLIMALFFSIVVEWVGMVYWWPDEGADHAKMMLENELHYLDRDFYRSIVTASPMQFAANFVDTAYHYLFEWTGFTRFLTGLFDYSGSDEIMHQARMTVLRIWPFIESMLAITQLFFVRLAILTLATPIFVLAFLAGLTDGLVQRDLRRWGGGLESSFLYHQTKRFIVPMFISAWMVYLAMPISVHPSWIILPFALLFGGSTAVTMSTFKKYL